MLCRCNNVKKSSDEIESTRIIAKIDGCDLTLDADSTHQHNVKVSIGQITSFSTTLRGGERFNILDSLKHQESKHYELAYTMAQNEGLINAHITIPNKLDTTLQCQFKYSDFLEHKGEITSGEFAKIVNTFDSVYIDPKLRKWVYKNKKVNIGDSLFNDMRLYFRYLSTTENTKFVIQGPIPSFKETNLKGTPYKVSSDMVADNYFLCVCDNDTAIDSFIEEKIARNMSEATKSLETPIAIDLFCKGSSGTMCIFLIGINNDWTSQVLPLGVVSIDDVPPVYDVDFGPLIQHERPDGNELHFPKRGFSIDRSGSPKVHGWWKMSNGKWEGYGKYIRVPYTFTWEGDVSKLTFDRGDGKIVTINLEDKQSPYHIDIICKIETGDNYYEVKAYDKLGNSSKYDYYIGAKEVKNESPQINIDNNIWN